MQITIPEFALKGEVVVFLVPNEIWDGAERKEAASSASLLQKLCCTQHPQKPTGLLEIKAVTGFQNAEEVLI